RAEAVFEQRVGVGAPQHRAATRTFPLSMLLFEVPRFELDTTPAEILRGDPAQRCESRDAEARQDLRRYFVEEPRPAAEPAGRLVIEFALRAKQLRFSSPHALDDGQRYAVQDIPNG